jgi:hypothetical protein
MLRLAVDVVVTDVDGEQRLRRRQLLQRREQQSSLVREEGELWLGLQRESEWGLTVSFLLPLPPPSPPSSR